LITIGMSGSRQKKRRSEQTLELDVRHNGHRVGR
jgi:hypothetical protein